MSTVHPNGFSPVLVSPSSTSHATLTNQHVPLYDNSDQGSVDSDYTSLSSSKFYGHGGSTSSLYRQGRSQSIDELASTATGTTTAIPTRHFNGVLNVNKCNNDPLQFVKIHPNHDLIERAQEQLTLAESRKRLQENLKFPTHHANAHKTHPVDDDNMDWSKAVENWRQKREQKRKQSVNSNVSNDDPPISVPLPSPIRKLDPPEPKVVSPPISTNNIVERLIPNRIVSKSPSPQRIKGVGKIHDVFLEKPLDIRGFGFKLDGGIGQRRPVYISTIEDGSLADKAGLCVDDEVLAMNGENIEQMTFDQVRKILKERNLRGSIQLLVRTYEDILDDNSQTVTTGPETEHSRTPSPQKPFSNPPAPLSTTTNTFRLSSAISLPASTDQSPVYTFSPYTSPPPPSTFVTTHQLPSPLSATPSVNIFAPKPFRTTASINLDTPNSGETNLTHSSPIEAFRKMLDTSNSIGKSMKNETKTPIEQQPVNVPKPFFRDLLNTPLSNPPAISSNITDSLSPVKLTVKPAPLTSVESLLHDPSNHQNNDQQRNESPIAQVRSSVEKQMNQLQQELLTGFPRASPPTSNDMKRDQRPVNIPVDLTNAAIPKSSIQQHNTNPTHQNDRISAAKVQPFELSNQQRPSSGYTKRSVIDAAITNRPLTTHSSDRTGNELRINVSSLYSSPPQENVSIQLDSKIPQQRISSKQIHTTLNQAPKKSNYDDYSWITDEQRQAMAPQPTIPPPPPPFYSNGGNARRPAPLASHPQERSAPNHLAMFHYGDHSDENHSRNRDFDPSLTRNQPAKPLTKSPIRTTISSNNNRVLSVSGKLRCSRCHDELGQGSAMVIESLGLYYHIECFRCFVCNIPLSSSFEGTDVRVRNNRLHCQNCFSDDNGVKLSAV